MKPLSSYVFFLALLFSKTSQAQKIVYSPPEKQDFNRSRFDVITKHGDNILVYKAVYMGNPFTGRYSEGPLLSYANPTPFQYYTGPATGPENGIEQSKIVIYDSDMDLRTEKVLPLPKEISGVHFLVYDDFFYIFYQYLVKHTIFCMAAKVNMDGDLIGDPIQMDQTTVMDMHYQSQIYTAIYSEDKKNILLFNENISSAHPPVLNSILFDKELHPLRRSTHVLTMPGSEYLSEFRIDNEGNFIFIGLEGKAKYHNAQQAVLFILPRYEDSLNYTYVAPASISVDDIHLLIDNRNKRYILSSFYSRHPEGDIEGLFCLVRDANGQTSDKISLTVLSDSMRILVQKRNTKTIFNDFYLQEMHLRKDGSYTIEAQQIGSSIRTFFSRWNYLPRVSRSVATEYAWYDPYEHDHYFPWRLWHTGTNAAGYSSESGLIMCLDSTGIAQWVNIFHTPQLDGIPAKLGYKIIIGNGLLYFLYNVHIRRQDYLTAQSINTYGELNTDPQLKEDKALYGQSDDYTYFPRMGKTIDAGEVIVPCRKGRYMCLAKISF